MMKLYYVALSGHCHRVHLFLSLLRIDHQRVDLDLAKGEHQAPEFLKLNRFGKVPVLDDDGEIVPDSLAIMVYIAKKYGRTDWLPEDPRTAAKVQRWLSAAAGEVMYGPCAARLINLVSAPFNAVEVIARAHYLLSIVDAELAEREWLVGATPTVADVALYSYIARAPEGEVSLQPYPAIRAWLAGVEALPNFLAMPAVQKSAA